MSDGPTYRGKPIPEHMERLMAVADKKMLGLVTPPDPAEVAARVEKARDMSEKELQQEIAKYLIWRGLEFNVSRMDMASTCKIGWPDFTLGIRPMKFPCAVAVGFEVKLPGRNPTAAQFQQMANMIRCGWFVRVVHSVAEVKMFCDRIAGWNPNDPDSKIP